MMLERTESFTVDRAGYLVRTIVPRSPSKPYEHRCSLAAYQRVANEIDALGEAGFTGEQIVASTGLPFTQVAVAIAFLRERGCIVTDHKRNYAPHGQVGGVHADAMLEYHALREKA